MNKEASHNVKLFGGNKIGNLIFWLPLIPIDALKECGPHSNLNLVEFVWNYCNIMKCKMVAITAVPFDKDLRVLYLKHHWAASDGWTIHSLRYRYRNDYKNIRNLLNNCNLSDNCTCNLCLCQPPSLRCLASRTIFHFTYNIENFTLTHETPYDQYVYATHSNKVPFQNLIQNMYPKLIGKFTKEINRDDRLHFDCVCRTIMWSVSQSKHCNSILEMIEFLIKEKKEWWCGFCNRGLFLRPSCVRQYRDYS